MSQDQWEIRFVYESHAGVHSEVELSRLASDVEVLRSAFQVAGRSSIDMHGGVSFRFNGIELLGREYWVEDIRHLSLGVGVEQVRGFELASEVHESRSDLVHVNLHQRKRRTFSGTFDRSEWQTAWQLMRARGERVREALGDPEGSAWLDRWCLSRPDGGGQVVVADPIRQWVRNSPLDQVLRDGLP